MLIWMVTYILRGRSFRIIIMRIRMMILISGKVMRLFRPPSGPFLRRGSPKGSQVRWFLRSRLCSLMLSKSG